MVDSAAQMPVLNKPADVLPDPVVLSPPAPTPPPPPPPPPPQEVHAAASVPPPAPISLPSSAAEPLRPDPVPVHQTREVEERRPPPPQEVPVPPSMPLLRPVPPPQEAPVPPSVPPPAPIAVPSSAADPPRRRPAPAHHHQTRDSTVEERPIRVGKIQWPPPRDDDVKPEVHVGRLDIEEADEKNSVMSSTRPTAGDIRQRIHEKVIAGRLNQQPAAAPPASTQTVPVRLIILTRSTTNTNTHRCL